MLRFRELIRILGKRFLFVFFFVKYPDDVTLCDSSVRKRLLSLTKLDPDFF